MGAAHRFDPPHRVLIAALKVSCDAPGESRTSAQIAPQYGVDIAFGAPFLRQPAGTYRLVNNRIVGVPTRLERIYRAPDQRLHESIAAASVRQLAHDALHATIASQSTVRKVDQRRARRVRLQFGQALKLLGEAPAFDNIRHHARGIIYRMP